MGLGSSRPKASHPNEGILLSLVGARPATALSRDMLMTYTRALRRAPGVPARILYSIAVLGEERRTSPSPWGIDGAWVQPA